MYFITFTDTNISKGDLKIPNIKLKGGEMYG
jgi:hypothetical protein